jgi:hypothetical protein
MAWMQQQQLPTQLDVSVEACAAASGSTHLSSFSSFWAMSCTRSGGSPAQPASDCLAGRRACFRAAIRIWLRGVWPAVGGGRDGSRTAAARIVATFKYACNAHCCKSTASLPASRGFERLRSGTCRVSKGPHVAIYDVLHAR